VNDGPFKLFSKNNRYIHIVVAKSDVVPRKKIYLQPLFNYDLKLVKGFVILCFESIVFFVKAQ